MLRKRVIVCLDVDRGRVVKGVGFRDLRDVGDPVALARRYERDGADEVVFLDISASAEGRRTLLDTVRRTAERLFVPLTVGGGIATVDDVGRTLRAGADKVAINTAAVRRPDLVERSAARFGRQCVVISIDAKREAARRAHRIGSRARPPDQVRGFRAYTHGGRTRTALDAVDWAVECAERGAGEILLTSIDRDGRRTGYDLELTRRVVEGVDVPVIASGGAGEAGHLIEAFTEAGASAALIAGIVHDGATSVAAIKRALRGAGVPVRNVASDTDPPTGATAENRGGTP